MMAAMMARMATATTTTAIAIDVVELLELLLLLALPPELVGGATLRQLEVGPGPAGLDVCAAMLTA